MVNILELEKVRARILEYPENFNYEFIISKRRTPRAPTPAQFKDILKHGCNTCGCVAGFTVCALDEQWDDVMSQAKYILELTHSEKRFLFLGEKPYLDGHDPWYFERYAYPEEFHIESCSDEEGRTEALKRIDFILDHYRNLSNAVAS